MVFDVAQDSAGILWVATRSGISSYDGLTWTNYSVVDGLSPASFSFLKIDAQGKLWAIPQKGDLCIFLFNGKTWEKYACNLSPKISATFSTFDVTYFGDEVVLVIGTFNYGLFICKDQEWRQYTVQDGLPSNRIRGIYATGNKVYVATDNGLSVIQDQRVQHDLNLNPGLPSRDVLAIAPDRRVHPDSTLSRLWLLGNGWIGFVEGDSFSLCARNFRIHVSDIQSIYFLYPDLRGGVYFGNPFYLYYYQPDRLLELMGCQNGLVSDGASRILTDREKNIWIASYRGITKIPSKRFTGYTQTEGLFDNEVASALELEPGKYLFGHHGGLTFLKNGKFTQLDLYTSGIMKAQEMRIQDMDIDRAGMIWFAASSLGLGRLDRQGRIYWYRGDKGLQGIIGSVCVDQNGNVFASGDKRLFEYDPNRDVFYNLPRARYKDTGIRKLFPGKDDNLFLASFSIGLLERKNNQEVNYRSLDRKHANNVYAFFQDSKDRKWVGAADGLFLLVDTVLQKYDSHGLSISRPVYLILEDKQGNIWLGTDNGVFRWNGNQLDHFSVNEGFAGLEVNRDAGFVDSNGNLWFGTNNGLSIYSPAEDYQINEIPPPLTRLTFVEAENDTLLLDRDQVIPASHNTLVFHFKAISFIDERKVYFKCILEGFDNDWSSEIFAHTTRYRYTNLPPGTYRFCLKACNALGIWSEPVCSGTIRIKQPFWFQLWFIALVLASALSLIYGVGRFIIIRRYNLKLAKMVAIRTRELRRSEKDLQESNAAKDNFFSIIAHDLKSPFNAILGMLELLTTEYSEFSDQERQKILLNLRNASVRTIDLVDNLLTWAQAQKGLLPFNPEKFDLLELISENISLFEPTAQAKKVHLIHPDPDLTVVYADRNMINTVIRNLISNAIKFSFPQGEVTIKVDRTTEKTVTVAVMDTGTGMDKKTLTNLFILDQRTITKGTSNETGTGLGLILTKDFITRNKGKISVESEEGSGSTFHISLPVNPPN